MGIRVQGYRGTEVHVLYLRVESVYRTESTQPVHEFPGRVSRPSLQHSGPQRDLSEHQSDPPIRQEPE